MVSKRRLVAGLLAGSAACGAQAQDAPAPVAPAPRAQAQPTPTPTTPTPPAEPASDAARRVEFRGADGKPLPPEVQERLREHFKSNPLPTTKGVHGEGDVVVTGQRPRGSVVGDIPPERTFGQLDVRAFGADNIGSLLEALGPQVASNRGRGDGAPVTLLNGRRISNFSEIARIPTEAIERMEVFPEELALRYGYRADQKVVNIVTYQRFDSRIGQLGHAAPTEGGRDAKVVNADYLAIRGDARVGLGATYSRSGLLLESDRDVRQPSSRPELGRFRSLSPETEQVTLNGLVGGRVLDDIAATLNGRYEANRSRSLLGLDADRPLRRDADRQVVHLGATLNGRAGPWLWTFTGNYDRTEAGTLTDIGAAAGGRDEARSVDALANADLLLTGPIVDLPAGPLSASVRGGVELRDFQSRSSRGRFEERTELSRDGAAIQASLDLPLLSRAAGGSSRLGNLSANANLAIERLSDAGTLRTLGYGVNWSPSGAVGLIASVTHEEGAPTVEQLGGPFLVTPNVRVFDFGRREVVDVTRLSGGNAGLRPDDRRVLRLGLNVRPIARTDFTVSVDYVATRINDPIAAFPIVTPEIEAALPDRFTRDGAGRLVRIDARPVNFVRSDQERLRWGVNFTRPLGTVPQGTVVRTFASEADARRAFPNAAFVKAEAGSAFARRGENMTSRVFFSLYHNWRLEDSIVAREGLPALDLLDGSAVDFGGGQPRHEVEFQAGAFKRGLGVRVTVAWRSGTEVRGLGGAAGDLRFADFATVNLNLFANLADRFGGVGAPKWLKGARASVGVTNLFNTRSEVRDRAGATPLSYQPVYLDPLGRTLNVSLRKAF